MSMADPLDRSANIDPGTVEGFGLEWRTYDQTELGDEERQRLFDGYFSIFPWDQLSSDAEGFDLGCGSGRWAELVLGRVGILHCIDASADALGVAHDRLQGWPGARFHVAGVDQLPLRDGSQDFGYSLGVLHHIPDTRAALRDCVRALKIGAPFLAYLYYNFDNRPPWYRMLWRASEHGRRLISALPFGLRRGLTALIAAIIYWPFARLAKAGEQLGMNVSNLPLAAYRDSSFYTMRTDALDRFGTRLEQRFSRHEIEAMMRDAGLAEIRFRDDVPYWTAVGRRVA